jgi:hypothetical protein
MTSTALSRHEINKLDKKSLTKLLELNGKNLVLHLKHIDTADLSVLSQVARELVTNFSQYQMDISAKLDQFTAKYGFDQAMRDEAELLLTAQSILHRVDFNQLER